MLRRFFLLLALLAPLSAVRADVYVFSTLTVAKGYVGPVTIAVSWASSGDARDLTGATGSVTVYSTQPTRGVGGTVLWTKPISVSGSQATMLLGAGDTTVPGTYYCEISIAQGSTVDVWHGVWRVEGA